MKISLLIASLFLALYTPLIAAQDGISDGRYKSIKAQIDRWESKCVSTQELVWKKKYLAHLIRLQKKVDALGLTGDVVVAHDELCGGLLDPTITFIDIEPTNLILAPTDSITLTATIKKYSCLGGDTPGARCTADSSCGTGSCEDEVLLGEVIWFSDNSSVATVNQIGVVTGELPGSTSIFVVSDDLGDISGVANVEVRIPIASVEIVPSSAELVPGNTVSVQALLKDTNGFLIPSEGREIVWSSSNSDIATVDSTGALAIVTAQAIGIASVLAESEGKSGTAMIAVTQPCTPAPEVPDCSWREIRAVKHTGYYKCAPDHWIIDELAPEDEVYIDLEFTDCCFECCDECCYFCEYCDTWLGWGAEWEIEDQCGSQLNWNIGGAGAGIEVGYNRQTLSDFGNSGGCGHPTILKVEGRACWKASLTYVQRVGWNKAGTDFASAANIGQESSWCGSLNQAPCGGGSGGGYALQCQPEDPECSTNSYWKVYLDTGDLLEVAMSLSTGVYGGSLANLGLYDSSGTFVTYFWWWFFADEDRQSYFQTYTNAGEPDTFYVVLDVIGGGDLWEYALGFNVRKPWCGEDPPVPECDPACGECESCVEGVCVPHAAGSPCDDGNICNTDDHCDYLGLPICVAGVPFNCDDGNSCTTEACDPITGCHSYPVEDQTSCDDGNACTQGDFCLAGSCVRGGEVECADDGEVCTIEMCDPVDGCIQVSAIDGSSCDDGIICNGEEQGCLDGVCQPGVPMDTTELQEACISLISDTMDLCVPGTVPESLELNNWLLEVFVHTSDGTETTDFFCSDDRTGEACAGEGVLTDNSGADYCQDGGTPYSIASEGDLQCAIGPDDAKNICHAICTGCIP